MTTAIVALLVAGAGVAPAAADTSYPSWDDVQAAKANASATQAEVDRINGILSSLQTAANAAGDLAVKRAGEYGVAENALQSATQKADELQTRADQATAEAETLRTQSGKLAAQLSRSGGSELSLRLFLSGNDSHDASGLLYQLGTVSKLGEQASTLFASANEQKNVAAALSGQAKAAQKVRDKLAVDAESALETARSAQAAAEAQLASQQKHATVMYAQLATLKNTAASVEQKYAEGVAKAAADQEAANEAAGAGGGWVSAPSNMTVDPAAAQAYAQSRLGSYGWGGDQMSCLVRLWNQESGWRANAVNPSSDAYGIPQALPPSKMSTAGPDWLTNANTQINWGLNYISGRYGSPCGAWSHEVGYNWY
ncbi:coiled-coil domain-containing protein [Leifsonia sp. NPDC058292]|uniref:coiled-coil domain-containing protein n=1 Tax=Leifsonia sp. NPDC058292 TaxID=3346428 RepID=UPI0036DA3160